MEELGEFLQRAALIYSVILIATAVVVVLLLALSVRQIRKIHLPPDADFVTALRMTPLPVVVILDLLDLTLDFLSIPVAWVLLTALGLGPLRMVTAVEAFIPGTQVIPTMTLSWFAVRLLGRPALSAPRAPQPTVEVLAGPGEVAASRPVGQPARQWRFDS